MILTSMMQSSQYNTCMASSFTQLQNYIVTHTAAFYKSQNLSGEYLVFKTSVSSLITTCMQCIQGLLATGKMIYLLLSRVQAELPSSRIDNLGQYRNSRVVKSFVLCKTAKNIRVEVVY